MICRSSEREINYSTTWQFCHVVLLWKGAYMEVYFNGKRYDSMKELQNSYLKWLQTNESTFELLIKENHHILFESKFDRDNSAQNIFEYIHKELMKKFKELEKENMYLEMQTIEYELDLIDGLYVMCFYEMNEIEIPIIISEPSVFIDYISNEECLMMSQKCALYDIENNLSPCEYDDLVEEYMNLSSAELVFEYENKYNEDYHMKYVDDLLKTYQDPIIKNSVLKAKNSYKDLKQYYIQNNISLEMRKKQ